MAEVSPSSATQPSPLDISSHLPLQLVKSEIIPPAPTRHQDGSELPVDCLFNFFGYSWIAYGASSLLVICHLPSPLSPAEKVIGPIFRQVIELSRGREDHVCISAVAWSPVEPSDGELGAALDNCIWLYSFNSDKSSSCSCFWGLTAKLSQSTMVEGIKWTNSGDGIISGGIEVVFWTRKEKSWEISWKFTPRVPQILLSATWFIQGYSATAPCNNLKMGVVSPPGYEGRGSDFLERNCVLIYQGDGCSNYIQAEICHPMPVGMMQWRPATGKPSSITYRYSHRSVLLTCCLDGSARLWSEIDDGKFRRFGKPSSDQKSMRLSFCVISVIEVNQTLSGSLGSDIFVYWTTEVECSSLLREGTGSYSCVNDFLYDDASRCEWLVGFGPEKVIAFWSVHCLDDFTPVRFPRITLWKKQVLVGLKTETGQLLPKVVIVRNCVSGPPVTCSLVWLLPQNSFSFMQLYPQKPTTVGDSVSESHPDNPESYGKVLNADGHTGDVLDIAIHQSVFEVDLCASIDSKGMIIFWSFSTSFNSHFGLPISTPSWKLHKKISVSDNSSSYTRLSWAPLVLFEDRVLLLANSNVIDCFIIQTLKTDENLSLHKLCTIPIKPHGQLGLSEICCIPMPCNCNAIMNSIKFLLVALWKDEFQALSWEITIHCHDLLWSKCDDHLQTFESNFAGKKYSVSIDPCSSSIPAPHNNDKVTSCAVVCPNNPILSIQQKLSASNEMNAYYYAYHMVTGCVSGALKLWRSSPALLLSSGSIWDLVGILSSGQGSITVVSPSACCRKIATASIIDKPICSNTLCIWESIHIQSAGSFMLEDKLYLNGEVIALNWLTMGNGLLLLGVCLQNEVRVYAMQRSVNMVSLSHEKPLERDIWLCIAVHSACTGIRDFIWGPKGTITVAHNNYFSFFSQFLLYADKEFLSKCCPMFCQLKKRNELNPCINAENCRLMEFFTQDWWWSMSEIAEQIGGSLPLFHPVTLLINISSGNWKRALVALRHLVKYIPSKSLSRKGHGARVRSNIIAPLHLSNYLEGSPSSISNDTLFQWNNAQLQTRFSQFTITAGYVDSSIGSSSSSIKSEFVDFIEALEWLYNARYMAKNEMMQALSLVELLQEVSDPFSTTAYESLDESGRRFWVAVRCQQLYFSRRFNRLPLVGELVVSSDLIGWAFHSDCHEALCNSLLSAEPSWEELRSIGFGFWYSNVSQLRLKMERLARQQYMKKKDPKACTLLYIALNRLQVLAGLFKISKDEKDKPLARFLLRNFQEDNNKAAALKNAYVLMAKHQQELAVAFFLLGGDLSSAVTVCAKNLADDQLALVICRLVEGYGGPSEHNLISKSLLPSALSKCNNWMASFLEWLLGNYSQSFMRMFGVEKSSELCIPVFSSSHVPFSDPSIGQYCLMLAAKTCLKNAMGDSCAAVLCQLAAMANVSFLSRCGLPLEALECHSSYFGFESTFEGMETQNTGCKLVEMLKPAADKDSWNWTSFKTPYQTISDFKLNLAMQYLSNLVIEHPSSVDIWNVAFGFSKHEHDDQEFEKSLIEFHSNFAGATAFLQRKFSLIPSGLISMAVLYLHHSSLEFIGYNILYEYVLNVQCDDESNTRDRKDFLSHPIPSSILVKAAEEISFSFAKYVVFTCGKSSHLTCFNKESSVGDTGFCWLAAWSNSNQGITWSFGYLKAMLRLFLRSYSVGLTLRLSKVLALFKWQLLFAIAWLQRNLRALLISIRPILIPLMRGDTFFEIKVEDLNSLLGEIVEILAHDSSQVQLPTHIDITEQRKEQYVEIGHSFAEDNSWQIINASLWVLMAKFVEHQLDNFPQVLEEDISFSPTLTLAESEFKHLRLRLGLVTSTLIDYLRVTNEGVSVYCSRKFVMYVLQEVELSNPPVVSRLENVFCQTRVKNDCDDQMVRNLELSAFENLLSIFADWRIIYGAFKQEYFKCVPYINQKSVDGWAATYTTIRTHYESEETSHKKDSVFCESEEFSRMKNRFEIPRQDTGSPLVFLSRDDNLFKSSGQKDVSGTVKAEFFHNPKEILKRNGELLEALCVNSVDRSQAALASNRKGIIFFNWEDGAILPGKSEYLWGEVDWPHNGWAGSDSNPIPSSVYPGIGFGNKKETGPIVGPSALPTAGRDSPGGGALGIQGYAGMRASNFGWGVQESFDEYIDPPATVDNVRTRAFASHPSRPLFLVGSSNTHIYLWEFGMERAIATYGVLPAANVPLYATASVSAVHFDHCGHRFVTAALDGTVSTWQLEVGGRSNIRPTESSSCFSIHTLDATYVTASGSIIAAAGYSSNGVNVVLWDTLAPPSTSQASIMCHEGGACSLSVFDNDIGSGSISPLILSGGNVGDVGLHDFRYIATGKTKRHKHSDSSEHDISMSQSVDMRNKTGDQNRNGMLWYIPKAHAGGVTKITTIPNTSFFLTGSNNGDVKLWDAKMAKLVFHWPRLHERHTFLQPSSRVFSGAVRAAVTDIQIVSGGFLTCGGDGLVKFVKFQSFGS